MDNVAAELTGKISIDMSAWDAGMQRLQANIATVVQQAGSMATAAATSFGRLTSENEKAAEATNLNTKALQALSAQMAQIKVPAMAPSFQQATPAIGGMTGAVNSLAGAMQFLRRSLIVGELLDMARAMIGFGNETANVASNVGEATNRVNVLFGANAAQVDEWSKTTARSMGVSRLAALQTAGDYGNMFRAMSFSQAASAQFSEALIKTASDLASFNNVQGGMDRALAAIKSALAGQSRPLRTYGIDLRETALHSEALTLGLVHTTKEGLSPQMKALAALGLISKESKNAMGDFARTAQFTANSQRLLAANLTDLKEKFGELTLPIKQQATQALNGFIERVNGIDFHALIAAFSDFGQGIEQTVAAKIKPVTDFLLSQWQKVVSWFRENLPLIQRTVKTVIDFMAKFWHDHGAQILAIVSQVYQQIKNVISTSLTVVLDLVKFAMQVITGDWKSAGDTIKDLAKTIWGFVVDTFKNVRLTLYDVAKTILSVVVDMAHRLGIALLGIGKTILDSMAGFAEHLLSEAGPKFAAVGDFLGHALGEGIFAAIRFVFGGQAEALAREIADWAGTVADIARMQLQGATKGKPAGVISGSGAAAGATGPGAYGPPSPSPIDTLLGKLHAAMGSGIAPKDNTPSLNDAIKNAIAGGVTDQALAPGFGAAAGKAAAKVLREQATAWREAMAERRELYAAIRPREKDKFEIHSDVINENLAKLLQRLAGNPKALATIGKKAIADAAKVLDDNRKERDAFYANVRAHAAEELRRHAAEVSRQAAEAAKVAGAPLRTVQNALASEQARSLRVPQGQTGQYNVTEEEAANTKRALALQLLHTAYEGLALPIRNVLDQLAYLKVTDEAAVKSHTALAAAAKKTAETIRTQAVDALRLQAEQTHRVSEGMGELATRFDGLADHSDRLLEAFRKFGIEQKTATAQMTADVTEYKEKWDLLDTLEKQRRQIQDVAQTISGPLGSAFETTFARARLSSKTFFQALHTDIQETIRKLAAQTLTKAVTGGIMALLGQAVPGLDNSGIDKKAAAARDDLFRAAERLDITVAGLRAAAAALAASPASAAAQSAGNNFATASNIAAVPPLAIPNLALGNIAPGNMTPAVIAGAASAAQDASTRNISGAVGSLQSLAALHASFTGGLGSTLAGFSTALPWVAGGLAIDNILGDPLGKLLHLHLAAGAWEVPGRGMGDTIPAMLTPGEMVIPQDVASAVRSRISDRSGSGASEAGGGDTYHFHNATFNDKADVARIRALTNDRDRMKFFFLTHSG